MTFRRGCIGPFALILMILQCASSLPAQESRWQELNGRLSDLLQQGEYQQALPTAIEALKVAEATFTPDDAKLGTALYNLASAYDHLADYTKAEPLYERSLRIRQKALPPDDPDIAATMNNLGEIYDRQGSYAQAEPLLERALQINEKNFGADDLRVATTLNDLAYLYFDQGNTSKAVPLFERGLPIIEKTFGAESPLVVAHVGLLAGLYYKQGRYAQAESFYQRALNINEKILSPSDPVLATSLSSLASVYLDDGKYKEAEPLDERALQIREKILGPEHHDVALSLNDLASVYTAQGRYAEALSLFQRALGILEKSLGLEHPDVASTVNNIALVYVDQGKYAEAEPLYQRALRIDEKMPGADDAVATNLGNLADVYFKEGRYAEAEPLYKRGLGIREKTPGPDSPDLATALKQLGSLYAEQGKFAEAEPLFQRALRIDEKVLGPEHSSVAVDLDDLGNLYVHQGKYTDAEPLLQRALSIDEKAFGPANPSCATDLIDLARLYQIKFRYKDAEPLLQRALSIDEKALGPDHPDVATALNNLAAIYVHEAKYAEAEPLYQRALRIDEKALGAEHPELATNLNNLAKLLYWEGKYAEAEPLFNRALGILEKTFGPLDPDLPTGLNNLALVYYEQGNSAAAEQVFKRAFDTLLQQFEYSFSYMSEKDRLSFLGTVSYNFSCFFSFVHHYRTKDPKLIGSMYDLLLWEKGFVAGSIADMRRAVEASGDPEALSLLGQLTAKRTQIAALLNVNQADRQSWLKQVDQLRTEANDIEKALVARSSAFAERKKLERATWQQVRDALQPGEAAVEFAHFDLYDKKWTDTGYYVALVVTPKTQDQPEYIFLGDDKKLESGGITRFQHAVQERGLEPEQQVKLPGAEAYNLIFKPLEMALAGVTRMYLCPDGVLNQIPLGIIPTPDGQLLMEKYDLRLLSSTKDILRATPQPAEATALLVGDPVFDLSEEQQRAAMQKVTLPQKQLPVLIPASSPDALSSDLTKRDRSSNFGLPRLPGTGLEVRAIAQLLQAHQWKTTVYTNDLALKRVVEQAQSPRVVHLATHGFFLPDQQINADGTDLDKTQPSGFEDPMLRSGLYFAGASRTLAGKPTAGGLDNGVLTAMEAGSLNLRGTELVVLSACNTGQGDVRTGEGVFGLRRALQEAGAQAVLMSLWSVPDQETQDLMKRFYAKWLAGMEIHEALKEAQLETREQVKLSHKGADLPYYWGAFVLVGR
jgi:tetratricopeptide (TPR) repeat protein